MTLLFRVAFSKYRMRLSNIRARVGRRKDVIQAVSKFCCSYSALRNTVKRTLRGFSLPDHSLAYPQLGLPWGVFSLAFPGSDERHTNRQRLLANRNLVPRRKRLWGFRHMSRFLESFQHLEKEPVFSRVKFQMQPEQAFACCDFFLGSQGLVHPRLHRVRVKSLNLAEKCGRTRSPNVDDGPGPLT